MTHTQWVKHLEWYVPHSHKGSYCAIELEPPNGELRCMWFTTEENAKTATVRWTRPHIFIRLVHEIDVEDLKKRKRQREHKTPEPDIRQQRRDLLYLRRKVEKAKALELDELVVPSSRIRTLDQRFLELLGFNVYAVRRFCPTNDEGIIEEYQLSW